MNMVNKKIVNSILSFIVGVIMGTLYITSNTYACSLFKCEKLIRQNVTENKMGLFWNSTYEYEVGDVIEYAGMNFRITSVYPNTVILTSSDSDIKDVYIPDEIVGDDGQDYEVTAIDGLAFYGNNKIKSVSVGDGVKTIGDSAFQNCKNLKEVEIGKKVKKIGNYAFYNCKKLKTIDLYPAKSLKSVGKKAFKKINKKYKIHCKNNKYKKKYQKLFKGKIGS